MKKVTLLAMSKVMNRIVRNRLNPPESHPVARNWRMTASEKTVVC